MTAVLYARVSTDDQADRGTIENQIIFAEKYADLHQVELLTKYKDDGISGVIPFNERESGKKLLEDAQLGRFDTVLVYKLDRLGRTARNILNAIAELEEKGLKVKSLTEPFDTETPTGRLMITMLAGFADLDRSNILERLQYGTEIAAQQGKWLGGIVPYGYRVNNMRYLETNEDKMSCGYSEADIVRMIYNLITEENLSTLKVADRLNDLNIPTHYIKDDRLVMKGKRKVHTDGLWRPNRIGNLVRNSVYMGIHEYGKRTIKNRQTVKREVPAIVSQEIYYSALEHMKNNRLGASRNTRNRDYLLRGLLKCGQCGRTYIGTSFKSKKINDVQTYLAYYTCAGKSSAYKYITVQGYCTSGAVNADKTESYVWSICIEILNDPISFKERILKNPQKKHQQPNYDKQMHELNTALIALENERQSILTLYRKNLIGINDVEIQLKDIEKHEVRHRGEINFIESKLRQKKDTETKTAETLSMLAIYRTQIIGADLETKRTIINALISRINVYRKKEDKEAVFDVEYSFF